MNACAPNIKFIKTKKSHRVWQSQQCQCTTQKLTSIQQANNYFLPEKNVTWVMWFRWLTTRPRGQLSWERSQYCTRPRPNISASRPRWGLNIPALTKQGTWLLVTFCQPSVNFIRQLMVMWWSTILRKYGMSRAVKGSHTELLDSYWWQWQHRRHCRMFAWNAMAQLQQLIHRRKR